MTNGAGSEAGSRPLRARVFGAALTSGSGEVVTRVLAVALSILTARVLEPAQVGILGLAAIIIGVISIVGYYCEIAAVAHGRSEDDATMALAATIIRAVIVGSLAVILTGAFPFFATRLAGAAAPLFMQVTAVFGLTLFFEMLSGYPSVILQRHLDLTLLAILQALQAIVAVTSAAAFLLGGAGPVGVAWANVIASGGTTVFLWWRMMHAHRARPSLPPRHIWQMTLRGTGAMFVGLFGGFLSERFDNLLVAGSIGPRAMSFYSMAWNASHTPANVFSRAINFVLVPALAHIQEEAERAKRALRECLRYSYALLAPVCAFFVIAGSEIIICLLGAKWLPAADPLRIMAVSVLAAPLLFASTAVLVGAGRAQWTGISTTLHLVMLAVLIPPMARWGGVRGAAIGELIAVILLAFTVFTTARIVTRLVTVDLLSAPLLPLAAASVAAVAAWFTAGSVTTIWVRLIVKGLVLSIVYIGSLAIVARDSHLKGLIGLLRAFLFRGQRVEVANA